MGELLDQAARIYRGRFFLFTGITGVVLVPITLLQIGSAVGMYLLGVHLEDDSGFEFVAGQGFSALFSLIQYFLIEGIAKAAMAHAVTGQYLGIEISILGAFRKLGRRWWRLPASYVMVGLLLIPLSLWSMVPLVGWFTGPGIFVFLWTVILPLLVPVVTLENTWGLESIRRVKMLAWSRFWWLLGFALTLFLFNFFMFLGPSMLISSITLGVVTSLSDSTSAPAYLALSVSQALSGLVSSLLFTPLASICGLMVYFDLRMRYEGLDLILQANQAAPVPLAAGEVLQQALPTPPANLVTRYDLGRFALLTLAISALYFVPLFFVSLISGILVATSGW